LRLLHLPLDAVANALLHLQDADLGFHVGVDALQPVGDRIELEQLLLVGDLQGEMRSHRVGELARILNLVDRNQDLRRDLLVQLDILFELPNDGTRQGFQLLVFAAAIGDDDRIGLEKRLTIGKALDPRPLPALNQHLHCPVR
jgi:hypothetical protein